MTVLRHFTAAISGTLDISELKARVNREHPDITIGELTLPGGLKGMQISSITSGTLLDSKDVEFSVDALAFTSGIIIFEISINGSDLPGKVTETEFLREKISITSNGNASENPLYHHCWNFFFHLLKFHDMLPKLADLNMVDDRNQLQVHNTIREISLIRTTFLGEQIYFNTEADFNPDCLVSISNDTDAEGEQVFAGAGSVYRRSNIWSLTDGGDEFISIYRYFLYRDNLLNSYLVILGKWLLLLGEESCRIRDNLDETNKVYWCRLRRKLETWELNFLSFLSIVKSSLNTFQTFNSPQITQSLRLEKQDILETRSRLISDNIQDIKYGIRNLRTPCEAHDEDLLQQETEKGNERIMLLSFLAMSIPLLGAILAPGISLVTKLISAALLISAPLVYQQFRKRQLERENSKAAISYLKTQRAAIVTGIEDAKKAVENIRSNPRLSEKAKVETIEFVKKTMDTSKEHLNQFDREIARLQGK